MNTPYTLWPTVPVMFQDCESKEDQLKHRIRRALEKAADYCIPLEDAGPLILDKLLTIDWLRFELATSPTETNHHRPWTPEEDADLRLHFGAHETVVAMAKLHGRSPGAITSRLTKLQLTMPPKPARETAPKGPAATTHQKFQENCKDSALDPALLEAIDALGKAGYAYYERQLCAGIDALNAAATAEWDAEKAERTAPAGDPAAAPFSCCDQAWADKQKREVHSASIVAGRETPEITQYRERMRDF